MEDIDDLIRRLRERAADPERRVDSRTSAFAAGVAALDPAELLAHLGRAQHDLARALAAGPDGPPPDLHARATELAARMVAPAEPGLRPPATVDEVALIGTVLGVSVPAVLRRALREVANGGFGPGLGLFGTSEIVRMTSRCRTDADDLGGWPAGRVPIADLGCGALACVATEQPDAPVLVLDPDLLEDSLADAFTPEAPSLAAWLDAWAASPSPAEQETADGAEWVRPTP